MLCLVWVHLRMRMYCYTESRKAEREGWGGNAGVSAEVKVGKRGGGEPNKTSDTSTSRGLQYFVLQPDFLKGARSCVKVSLQFLISKQFLKLL
jgi:hypothetical protein